MNTVKKGKAAEALVISKLLQLGANVYTPVSEDSKVDLIYELENRYIKVQVKCFGTGNSIAVRKIGVNSKTNTKIYWYTEKDVDAFAAVDLNTNSVYMIPISYIITFRSTISLTTIKEKFQPL